MMERNTEKNLMRTLASANEYYSHCHLLTFATGNEYYSHLTVLATVGSARLILVEQVLGICQ